MQGGVPKSTQHQICCAWAKAGCKSPVLSQKRARNIHTLREQHCLVNTSEQVYGIWSVFWILSFGIPGDLEAQRRDSDILEKKKKK